MNFAFQHDVGSFIKAVFGTNNSSQTAGATSSVNGKSFDRHAGERGHSALCVANARVGLASGGSFALQLHLEDSADGTNFDDYTDPVTSETLATAAGGAIAGTQVIATHKADMATARQYVRMVVAPIFSASLTDTAELAGSLIIGGLAKLPAE